MNEKLKKFLDSKKDTKTQKYDETKQKILIDLGLYEKVYSPDNKPSKEFSLYEWDSVNQVNKYYKKVPIEITDEEYQEIKKYVKEEEKKEEKVSNNPVATTLIFIAWVIFLGGFIAGVALGKEQVLRGYSYTTVFSFANAFVYWWISFISATLVRGFAEIIKLLDDINKK